MPGSVVVTAKIGAKDQRGDLDEWIVESLITALVLLVSTVLAAGLSFWIKKFVNTNFQIMQTVDIALAAMDFGSDVLFIITAFR
jgi:hypothetical protein